MVELVSVEAAPRLCIPQKLGLVRFRDMGQGLRERDTILRNLQRGLE